VLELFKLIPDGDCIVLNMAPELGRPEALILSNLLVGGCACAFACLRELACIAACMRHTCLPEAARQRWPAIAVWGAGDSGARRGRVGAAPGHMGMSTTALRGMRVSALTYTTQVPPGCLRPSVAMDASGGGGSNEDPLSIVLADILL